MAGKQRPTMGKRIREKNKREKKQAKLEEKARRKAEGGLVDDDIDKALAIAGTRVEAQHEGIVVCPTYCRKNM